MALGLGLGLSKRRRLVGGGDPLAGIPFLLRLQTHMGDNVPLGLYQDVACTTPAVLDGDPIAAWRDELSGGALTFVQADTQKQPMLFIDGGVPKVWFDGVDDILEIIGVVSTSLDFSQFALLQIDTVGGNLEAFNNGRETDGYGFLALGANRSIFYPGVSVLSDGSATTSEEVWSSKRVSGTATFRVNGSDEAVTNGTATPNVPSTTATIGAAFGGGFPYGGTISAILQSNPSLVDLQRNTVESYLLILNS